jgi:hypothetical protein
MASRSLTLSSSLRVLRRLLRSTTLAIDPAAGMPVAGISLCPVAERIRIVAFPVGGVRSGQQSRLQDHE